LGGRKGKGWRGQDSLDIGGLYLPFEGTCGKKFSSLCAIILEIHSVEDRVFD
jgi:hypothetical protein